MSAPRLLDRYELRVRVATGASGSQVYRGWDSRLDRAVAIKVFVGAGSDPGARRRFDNEARAAASLSHPGIVPIFDYSGPDAALPFIVMEWIEGDNLADAMRDRGPLPAETIVALLQQVASALDYAHGRGVLHRDVKPANLLLQADGTVRLTDFGVAERMRGDADRCANDSPLAGTPDFLAPEQIRDGDSSPESEVFALGSLAFWLCAGFSPYTADSAVDCMRNILTARRASLGSLRRDLPAALVDLIDRCHSPMPYERPRCREVAEDCRRQLAELAELAELADLAA